MINNQRQCDQHVVVLLWDCFKCSYLRTRVIKVFVARIHILCHDDDGQEVGGGQCARIAARISGRVFYVLCNMNHRALWNKCGEFVETDLE